MALTPKQQVLKIVCFLFGHDLTETDDKDMFAYKYIWQRVYCKRCNRIFGTRR